LESIDLDEKIVVLDGTFGQNTIELIKGFDKILKITGFAVSKIDSDQKGGVFFAIATASDKPIYYVSTGEKINNIVPFNKRMISDALFNIGGLKNIISSFQESNKEYIQTLIQKNKTAGLNYICFYAKFRRIQLS
jgi:signal recognition particle subunit SRP54